MSVTLEIFPNSSVYQLQTTEQLINLPVNIQQVTAFSKDFNHIPISLVNGQPFSIGQKVEVNADRNYTGRLIQIDTDYVDLFRNQDSDNLVTRIYNPKDVTVKGNYAYNYYVPHDDQAIITGVLKNLTWNPTYSCVIDSQDQTMVKLSLLAQVQFNGPSFEVNQLIFNTKEILNTQPDIIYQAQAQIQSQTQDLQVENTYYINQQTMIYPEMNLLLANYDQLKASPIYFLEINEQAVPKYGYILSLASQVPSGAVTIYNDNFKVVGISQLEIYANMAILKVAPENKLVANVYLERSEKSLQFSIEINSYLSESVQMVLQLPMHAEVIESNPPIDDRLPGMLIWYIQVAPGSNQFNAKLQHKK